MFSEGFVQKSLFVVRKVYGILWKADYKNNPLTLCNVISHQQAFKSACLVPTATRNTMEDLQPHSPLAIVFCSYSYFEAQVATILKILSQLFYHFIFVVPF